MVDCGVTENTSSDRVELGLGMTKMLNSYTLCPFFSHTFAHARAQKEYLTTNFKATNHKWNAKSY